MIAVSSLAISSLAAAREADRRALWVESGESVALSAAIDRMVAEGAEAVFLGERHDNAVHHRLQARIAADIAAGPGGRPVAGLAFEMIAPEKEDAVQAARGWPAPASAEASRSVGAAVGWEGSGWPDWALYAPILEAAPEAYVAGGWYPREALMAAAKAPDWLAAEPDAATFGLDQALPPAEQAARDREQIEAHCDALPATVAPRLVAAQRARDARLAAAVLRARARAAAEGRPGPVLAISGAGHARKDHGAAALLARAAPDLRIVSLAFVELADPEDPEALRAAGREAAGQFDLIVATSVQEREDPCAAFRKDG